MQTLHQRIKSKLRIPGVLVSVALLLLLALAIAACGGDDEPAATAAPVATATATPAPTMAAKIPVKTRLVTANPVDGEQFTIPYPGSQVSWAKMPEYEHLIGHDIRSNEELPELAHRLGLRYGRQDVDFRVERGRSLL